MNRRDFLRKTALAALMATPAMRAMAFAAEWGLPITPDAIGRGVTLASGQTFEVLAWYFRDELHSPICLNLNNPRESVEAHKPETCIDELTVMRKFHWLDDSLLTVNTIEIKAGTERVSGNFEADKITIDAPEGPE